MTTEYDDLLEASRRTQFIRAKNMSYVLTDVDITVKAKQGSYKKEIKSIGCFANCKYEYASESVIGDRLLGDNSLVDVIGPEVNYGAYTPLRLDSLAYVEKFKEAAASVESNITAAFAYLLLGDLDSFRLRLSRMSSDEKSAVLKGTIPLFELRVSTRDQCATFHEIAVPDTRAREYRSSYGSSLSCKVLVPHFDNPFSMGVYPAIFEMAIFLNRAKFVEAICVTLSVSKDHLMREIVVTSDAGRGREITYGQLSPLAFALFLSKDEAILPMLTTLIQQNFDWNLKATERTAKKNPVRIDIGRLDPGNLLKQAKALFLAERKSKKAPHYESAHHGARPSARGGAHPGLFPGASASSDAAQDLLGALSHMQTALAAYQGSRAPSAVRPEIIQQQLDASAHLLSQAASQLHRPPTSFASRGRGRGRGASASAQPGYRGDHHGDYSSFGH